MSTLKKRHPVHAAYGNDVSAEHADHAEAAHKNGDAVSNPITRNHPVQARLVSTPPTRVLELHGGLGAVETTTHCSAAFVKRQSIINRGDAHQRGAEAESPIKSVSIVFEQQNILSYGMKRPRLTDTMRISATHTSLHRQRSRERPAYERHFSCVS